MTAPLSSKQVFLSEDYDPNNLLDTIMYRFGLRNDVALAMALKVSSPHISKIRHKALPVTASVILRLHLVTEIPVAELYQLMGATIPNVDKLKLKRK